MSELVVRQTVVSGSEVTTFELLEDGMVLAEHTLDREIERDRLVLEDAQRAVNEALRVARARGDSLSILSRGPSTMLSRDCYAETQAMVRAFADVLWPGLVRPWR